ncbi:MAG: DUF6504 family protein [Actinomycetota bacterium]
MSKRYGEPIQVEAPEGTIEAFWWRGKRYTVRQIHARWRETGGWWDAAGETAQPWAAGDAREIVRIDAGNGSGAGTYEIARDLRDGVWTLARVWD